MYHRVSGFLDFRLMHSHGKNNEDVAAVVLERWSRNLLSALTRESKGAWQKPAQDELRTKLKTWVDSTADHYKLS